ncbi:MAG: DHA2 family efflux MFS transporter permease subunit [Candidatus Dormibacteraeota bacterium]|nr:DHA2 family efflux MFS transporter permease subunit [Candidatus Dormibacteraeota bacterium]
MRMAPSAVGAPAVGAARIGSGLNYKWVAGGVVMLGAIMVILDQTVVTVALPTLEADFNASLADVQWIITAYTLALAAVIPLTGWVADRFGTKRVFITSQALFVIGSALCGLAWSNGSLIGFRILQGLGGGMIMPVGMTILMSLSDPHERGRMMSVLGVPMMIGPILGPTLGGWLVQAVSWRAIFYINLPIGIIGVALGLLILRAPLARQIKREPLDVIGLLLITPAVVGIVYGLSQPGQYGWGSVQVLLPLLGGVALLVVFILFELRQRLPLIDIRIFRDPAFGASMTMNFLIGLALFGAVFLFPLFLQQIQGYTALKAGLLLGFQGLGAAVSMPISGILTDRFGARWVVPFGITVLVGATVWMTTLAFDTSWQVIAAMLVLRGVGMGFSMMPSMSSAYVTLAPSRIARATSVANVVQRVASGLGIAIMATILGNRINANMPKLPPGRGAASTGATNLAGLNLPPAIKNVILEQATKGFTDTFWVAVGLAVIALPVSLLLRKALRPEEIRRYAVRELAQGIVLGAAAREIRKGRIGDLGGRVDPKLSLQILTRAATERLQKGLTVMRLGGAASGMVPQAGLSRPRMVVVAVLLVVAVVASVMAVVHGYQTPTVPALPLGHPPAAA